MSTHVHGRSTPPHPVTDASQRENAAHTAARPGQFRHGNAKGAMFRLGLQTAPRSGRSSLPKSLTSRSSRGTRMVDEEEGSEGGEGLRDASTNSSDSDAGGGRGRGNDQGQPDISDEFGVKAGRAGAWRRASIDRIDDGWARQALAQGDDALVKAYASRLLEARDALCLDTTGAAHARELRDKITVLDLGGGRALDVGGLARARARLIEAQAARNTATAWPTPVSAADAERMGWANLRLILQLMDATQRLRTAREVRLAVGRLGLLVRGAAAMAMGRIVR